MEPCTSKTLPWFIILVIAGMHYADACSPAQKDNIKKLSQFFGIEPFYPNGQLTTNGYSDNYISSSDELNCNFNTDDSTLPDGNAKKSSVCKWKNLNGSRSDLDNEEFYLFTKTSDKQKWTILKPTRKVGQTPVVGDGFALSGGDGKPPIQAVYYSSPIACQENEGVLSFNYWIYNDAKVRVLVLAKDTLMTLYEAPKNACTRATPNEGLCSVKIPKQQAAFHLAIQAYDLNKQFVIIDNLKYVADLGARCARGNDPFDFGTTGTQLPVRNSNTPITTATDLNCAGGANCKWGNSPNGDVKFQVHKAPIPDADRWQAATGDATMPDGDFFMARGTTGNADLLGDIIACQVGEGLLTFRSWQSEGTKLEVCVVDADTLEPQRSCDTVPRPMTNGQPNQMPIFGPLNNARILLRGSGWNAGNGGFVAIDDITYEATMCSETTTVATTKAPVVTTPTPDSRDQNACTNISTNFNEATLTTTNWKPYDQTAYQGFPVKKFTIDSTFATTPNTQVDCPDGSRCAGLLLDKTQGVPIGIAQSVDFPPLAKDRYLEVTTRRGVYGTTVHLCVNQLPQLKNDSSVIAGSNCKLISGPNLTYDEFVSGKVTGGTLPKGTKKIYLVFTNPPDSGADRAGFLVDNLQLLKDNDANSAPLCEASNNKA